MSLITKSDNDTKHNDNLPEFNGWICNKNNQLRIPTMVRHVLGNMICYMFGQLDLMPKTLTSRFSRNVHKSKDILPVDVLPLQLLEHVFCPPAVWLAWIRTLIIFPHWATKPRITTFCGGYKNRSAMLSTARRCAYFLIYKNLRVVFCESEHNVNCTLSCFS